MFHPLSDVPEQFQRHARNRGWYDKPVGFHIKSMDVKKKDSVAYRRIWIMPKYLPSGMNNDKK